MNLRKVLVGLSLSGVALLVADQVALHTALADGELLGHELAPFAPPLYSETQRRLLAEYEDRLEGDLRECLMLDSRSPESAVKEGEVLKELLEISEHREKLQAMLERDKARYVREDKDMEAQMAAKGISIT